MTESFFAAIKKGLIDRQDEAKAATTEWIGGVSRVEFENLTIARDVA